MFRQIVVALFLFILLALVVIWVLSGGPRAIVTATKDSFNSISATGEASGFRLPWQPIDIFPTPDITELMDITTDEDGAFTSGGNTSAEERLRELEAEYDRLRGEVAKRSAAPPSPYAGKIAIAQDRFGAQTPDPRRESIQIIANYGNSEAVDISGWTLQSALSSSHIQIPVAASPLMHSGPQTLGGVTLEPGGAAIVATSFSPVGLSFRENMCIGYLQQSRSFEPPLTEDCPTPSELLPLTEHNLQQYGEACFDAVKDLSACRAPRTFPDTASPACRAFLTNTLSYEGCVRDNRFKVDFQKNTWRLYLNSPQELWSNAHDAIRLLDAQGRTVSVFVY